MLNGLLVSVPNKRIPSKNRTCVTLPAMSVAETLMVKLVGAMNEAPFVGLVIDTVGGTATLMWTTDDVDTPPKLSVACAVRSYPPAGTLLQVIVYGGVVSVSSSVLPL